MKQLYSRFNEVSFRLTAVIILALSDLIASFLFYLNISDEEAFLRGWAQMQKTGSLEMLQVHDASQFATQIHGLMVKSVLLAIILHIIFHWAIYLGYYYEKRLPFLYLKMVTWIFAFFTLWGLVAAIVNGEVIGLLNLFTFCGYLFVALGLRIFPLPNAKIQER